jgi:hypothetical protein
MLNYLPLIIIVLGLAVMAFFLIRNKNMGHSLREATAKEMGWEYIKGSQLYTAADNAGQATLSFVINSNNNKKWSIESHLHLEINNRTFMPYTVFKYKPNISIDGLLIFIPNPSTGLAIKDNDYLLYLDKIKSTKLPELAGIDMSAISGLSKTIIKNECINNRYNIFTSGNGLAEKIVSGSAEYFLADYLKNNAGVKKIPSISLTSKLFEIKLNYTLEKASEIKIFAELGESFIESIKRL